MAKRTKIRGAMPTIVSRDEADGVTSYELEIAGHRISLPVELARAWASRVDMAAKELERYAMTGWALFKPERIADLRSQITRARSQAGYWHGQTGLR